jgi:hypothetical protein
VTIPQIHEVRVTARLRVSTRSDFIAPDVSPVSTLAAELDKGLAGWTAHDVKLSLPVNGGVIVGRATEELAALTAGTEVIRRTAPTGMRVAHRTGPRSGRKTR